MRVPTVLSVGDFDGSDVMLDAQPISSFARSLTLPHEPPGVRKAFPHAVEPVAILMRHSECEHCRSMFGGMLPKPQALLDFEGARRIDFGRAARATPHRTARLAARQLIPPVGPALNLDCVRDSLASTARGTGQTERPNIA